MIVKRGMETFLRMKCFVDRGLGFALIPLIGITFVLKFLALALPPSLPKYGAEVAILWAGRPSRLLLLLLLLLFAKIGKLALSLFRSFVSFPVISPSEIRN